MAELATAASATDRAPDEAVAPAVAIRCLHAGRRPKTIYSAKTSSSAASTARCSPRLSRPACRSRRSRSTARTARRARGSFRRRSRPQGERWLARRFAMSGPLLRWIARGARRLAGSPRTSGLSAHVPGLWESGPGRCRRASLRPVAGRGFHVGHDRATLIGVGGWSARRRTSSASSERRRRRRPASTSAVRTASDSLRPSRIRLASAFSEGSSRRARTTREAIAKCSTLCATQTGALDRERPSIGANSRRPVAGAELSTAVTASRP